MSLLRTRVSIEHFPYRLEINLILIRITFRRTCHPHSTHSTHSIHLLPLSSMLERVDGSSVTKIQDHAKASQSSPDGTLNDPNMRLVMLAEDERLELSKRRMMECAMQ